MLSRHVMGLDRRGTPRHSICAAAQRSATGTLAIVREGVHRAQVAEVLGEELSELLHVPHPSKVVFRSPGLPDGDLPRAA
jgi:hypothetical protein